MITQALRKRPVTREDLLDVVNKELVPVLVAARTDLNKLQAPPQGAEEQVGLSVNVDWTTKRHALVSLSASVELTVDDPADAGDYMIVVHQVGGGNNITAWPASFKWPGAVAPTVTATDGRYDLFRAYWDGTQYLVSYEQDFG